MSTGKLYLIPTPIGATPLQDSFPVGNFYIIRYLKHFVVEEISTARRFLSRAGLKGQIDSLHLYELNEHTDPAVGAGYVSLLLGGNDVGLMSEAGLPAVADPGNILVAACQSNDIQVIPLIGPSSLMLALMASGLNGQGFAFNGYLPVKDAARKARLKELESLSKRSGMSQIFIETPYRNDALLASILTTCTASTLLAVAADIAMPTEFIKTKSVGEWRKEGIVIGRKPCVFILQG